MKLAVLLAAALAGVADPPPPQPAPAPERADVRPPGALRPGDEELLRHLEVLENLELLRHLDLLDPGEARDPGRAEPAPGEAPGRTAPRPRG